MDWDQITDDWAAMTRRLGNGGLHAPGLVDVPQEPTGSLPKIGPATATATTEAAQAVVTVARRLAGM